MDCRHSQEKNCTGRKKINFFVMVTRKVDTGEVLVSTLSNFMIGRHIVGHYWFLNNENLISFGKENLELFGHQF